jgi:hypothetical protein
MSMHTVRNARSIFARYVLSLIAEHVNFGQKLIITKNKKEETAVVVFTLFLMAYQNITPQRRGVENLMAV